MRRECYCMRRRDVFLLLVPLLIPSVAALAGGEGKPRTPKPGSAERKAIMDSLRPSVEPRLKQKVIFQVDTLNLMDGWAFLHGVPRRPNGAPIDYTRTEFAEAKKEGMFGDSICALLRHSPKGGWKVVTYHIGATDVFYADWDRKYHCPRAILDLPKDE